MAQPWQQIGLEVPCTLPFTAETGKEHPLSASSTQHMWKPEPGDRTAVLPRHADEAYQDRKSCPWLPLPG